MAIIGKIQRNGLLMLIVVGGALLAFIFTDFIKGGGDDYEQLDMGTSFDYFGKEAHHGYRNLPDSVKQNRRLLKKTMYHVGLIHIRTEWWHYSYLIKKYPISDMLWNCD